MSVAAVLGHFPSHFHCLESHQIAYLGLRSVDPLEAEILEEMRHDGTRIATMDEIRTRGVAVTLRELLRGWNESQLHVSFDIDAVDPLLAPGTGTPVEGGLTYPHVLEILRGLQSQNVMHVDMVEVNPALGGALPHTPRLAAAIAMDLIHGSSNVTSEYVETL